LSTQLLETSTRAAEAEKVDAAAKRSRSVMDAVITHCEEPLDWLRDVAEHVRRLYIYHKGRRDGKLHDYLTAAGRSTAAWASRVTWIPTENVGREGHTILLHCLTMKRGKLDECGAPSDLTLFLQGGVDDHKPMVYPFAHFHRYAEHEYNAVWGEWYANPGHIVHNDRYKQELREGSMQPTKLTFCDYYELLMGRPFPPSGRVFVSYCNKFSVANKRILAHSASFYERAMLSLSAGKNPATGHYFERLARAVFGGGTPNCSLPFLPIHS
jgi:hypothetical protein